ncbi:MAG TPA: PSD1 and planctomycete cytochrome C domain-containing protein [Bryobacteraceae bacterium]|nr:PSD1 and planctomycete cytochrome C domain-containing protein [Bryobacteraceae bacterium]
MALYASPDETDFFETRVRPVLATHCYACHSQSKLGGLQLDSRAALLRGGVSGPAVVPGQPADSLLIKAVNHSEPRLKMPLSGAKLKDQEIADLTRWIAIGAPWPEGKPAPAPLAGRKGFVLTPEARKFWSFQPIQKPAVPKVSNPQWTRNAIDNFILARLEERRMKPLQPAGKRVLIRRASYDLIGLPPTPEQIEAFEKDDSPDAFAKVVDRLLASPHYGERWGRHWLDAVRYAEGDGPEDTATKTRPPAAGSSRSKARARGARAMVYAGYGMTRDGYANAWRYRDWVIDAFNKDLPYDVFVKAQIAADLLPGKERSRELLPGLGLFGLGPWFTADCVPFNESRAEERDPKVDVLTKAFLGMTVTCARCHDHKYDPISQKDYTALVGVFNSSGYTEYPLAPEEQFAGSRAYQAKVRARQDALGQFLEMTTIGVSRRAAQDTGRYMMGARQVLLGKSKADAAIASTEGLDPATFKRWIKYLGATEREHPYLKEWDALMARGGGTDAEAQRLAGEFQKLVIGVIDEKKEVELFNRELRANYKPDPGEGSVLLPGDLMQFELFQFKHNVVQKHIAPSRYYVWMDIVQGPESSRVDDFGKRSGIYEYKDDELFDRFTPEENAELDRMIEELDAVQAAAPPEEPYVMGLGEIARPANMRLNIRGNPSNPGEEVPRGFPAVLAGTDGEPLPFTKGSGRLELAERIVRHPLAARVIVNRVWMEHFGRGLVGTTTNFGMMGDRPTNPGLLEYLAARLQENHWSIKSLHREIMLSSTYRLSYGHDASNAAQDPDNLYQWRANLRRLDAEELRDSILFFAATLDERVAGGPSMSVSQPGNKKRTVYAKVTRGGANRLLQLFDFPDPNISIDQRSATNVALQGLFFMNSDLMWSHAGLVASRFGAAGDDDAGKVKNAYRLLYGRQASAEEIGAALEFLNAAEKETGGRKAAWQQFAQAMLSSGEFNYIN